MPGINRYEPSAFLQGCDHLLEVWQQLSKRITQQLSNRITQRLRSNFGGSDFSEVEPCSSRRYYGPLTVAWGWAG
jgi:hypothetical protein